MPRNHIFCRPARPDESKTFHEWSANNPENGFDPEVARYPSTITWCVYDKSGVLGYMPMQRPIFFDSLAARPGLDKATIAMMLKELTQEAVTQAHITGAGEILFFGTEAGTDHMANNQLFERVEFPVYRLKIADLDKR